SSALLTACGPGEASRLVVTQSSDVPSGSDHKGHLAPGVLIGITLSIRNTGAGAARGVTVEDVLPAGFRDSGLTTLGRQGIPTGGMATCVVAVSNVGSGGAKRVVVSGSLGPGSRYTTATGYEGNSVRVATGDPPGNSLLPVWSCWDIPGAVNGAAGLLRLTFQARLLAGGVPGLYNLTVAVTIANDVPSQPIGNTAPATFGKGTTIPILLPFSQTA